MALPAHPFDLDTSERVGAIVLDALGNLLLIEGPGGKLSLPKGCRHLGESEYDGAVRECYEETGLDLEDPALGVKGGERIPLRWGVYFKFQLRKPGAAYSEHLRPQARESVRVFWAHPGRRWLKFDADCNADLKVYVRTCKKTKGATYWEKENKGSTQIWKAVSEA